MIHSNWKKIITQNGLFFPKNAPFIHFSYEYRTFLLHSKINSIVRQKYSCDKLLSFPSRSFLALGISYEVNIEVAY